MTGKDCVYVGTHLHVNDGIDEEQHGHEEADIKANYNADENKTINFTVKYVLHNTCMPPILTNGTFFSSEGQSLFPPNFS